MRLLRRRRRLGNYIPLRRIAIGMHGPHRNVLVALGVVVLKVVVFNKIVARFFILRIARRKSRIHRSVLHRRIPIHIRVRHRVIHSAAAHRHSIHRSRPQPSAGVPERHHSSGDNWRGRRTTREFQNCSRRYWLAAGPDNSSRVPEPAHNSIRRRLAIKSHSSARRPSHLIARI